MLLLLVVHLLSLFEGAQSPHDGAALHEKMVLLSVPVRVFVLSVAAAAYAFRTLGRIYEAARDAVPL